LIQFVFSLHCAFRRVNEVTADANATVFLFVLSPLFRLTFSTHTRRVFFTFVFPATQEMSVLRVRLVDDASAQPLMTVRLGATFRAGTVKDAAAEALRQFIAISVLPSGDTVAAMGVCVDDCFLGPAQVVSDVLALDEVMTVRVRTSTTETAEMRRLAVLSVPAGSPASAVVDAAEPAPAAPAAPIAPIAAPIAPIAAPIAPIAVHPPATAGARRSRGSSEDVAATRQTVPHAQTVHPLALRADADAEPVVAPPTSSQQRRATNVSVDAAAKSQAPKVTKNPASAGFAELERLTEAERAEKMRAMPAQGGLGWGKDAYKYFPANYVSNPDQIVRDARRRKREEEKARRAAALAAAAPAENSVTFVDVQEPSCGAQPTEEPAVIDSTASAVSAACAKLIGASVSSTEAAPKLAPAEPKQRLPESVRRVLLF
jgi:hypothetical protein